MHVALSLTHVGFNRGTRRIGNAFNIIIIIIVNDSIIGVIISITREKKDIGIGCKSYFHLHDLRHGDSLYSAVSLTLVRGQRFIRMIYYYYYY